MTPAGPPARATPTRRPPHPRSLIALASAVVLTLGLVVVVMTSGPRADAAGPLDRAYHGLAEGLDASSWQHPHGAPVDWHAAAAAGQSFAFIKATEGTGPAHRHYESDIHNARAARLLTGSYHMARPAMEPAQQAHAFADRLQSVGGPQLPPVLDLEYEEDLDPAELAEWTQIFLDTLTERTGRTPIIYTYRNFWIEKMANTTRFAEYPLWLAEYGVSQPTLPVIGGWSEWLLWQRAETGSVPGFVDHVDLNVFAGTREDLDAWSAPVEPAPAPEPAPEPVSDAPPAPPAEAPPAPAEIAADPAPGPPVEVHSAPETAPPAEPFTVAIPQDLPAPGGVRLPESIEIPGAVLEQVPPGLR